MDSRGWNGLTVWFEKTTPLLPLPAACFPPVFPSDRRPAGASGASAPGPPAPRGLCPVAFSFLCSHRHTIGE